MYLSPTASQALLNNISGKSSSATIGSNSNCWLALLTTAPNESGTGYAEVGSGKNYSRVNIYSVMNTTYKSYSQSEASATSHTRRIGNASDINFNAAIVPSDPDAATGADWGTIVGWALFSAQTGGSPYAWGTLQTPITINTQNTFHFFAGRFEMYLDSESGTVQSQASGSST